MKQKDTCLMRPVIGREVWKPQLLIMVLFDLRLSAMLSSESGVTSAMVILQQPVSHECIKLRV